MENEESILSKLTEWCGQEYKFGFEVVEITSRGWKCQVKNEEGGRLARLKKGVHYNRDYYKVHVDGGYFQYSSPSDALQFISTLRTTMK